jgi:8-oxo-dGTP diphosphatase
MVKLSEPPPVFNVRGCERVPPGHPGYVVDDVPHYVYRYKRAALTVDAVVFGVGQEGLKLLLIKRKPLDPRVPAEEQAYPDHWALPGGFVDVGESLDSAVQRELREETGMENVYLEQLYTFGDPGRDPREHVVDVSYLALVRPDAYSVAAASDASDVRWFPVGSLPDKMAFDHRKIFEIGFKRLKAKVRYAPLGFELLPEAFTIGELQRIYEDVLQRKLDGRNFRKKILQTTLLQDTGEKKFFGSGPKAVLYRFNKDEYERQTRLGINFEV